VLPGSGRFSFCIGGVSVVKEIIGVGLEDKI
jgi:hypothetical protein